MVAREVFHNDVLAKEKKSKSPTRDIEIRAEHEHASLDPTRGSVIPRHPAAQGREGPIEKVAQRLRIAFDALDRPHFPSTQSCAKHSLLFMLHIALSSLQR